MGVVGWIGVALGIVLTIFVAGIFWLCWLWRRTMDDIFEERRRRANALRARCDTPDPNLKS